MKCVKLLVFPIGKSSFAQQSAWDLWWTKWYWDRFSIAIITLSIIHTYLSICHQLYTILTTDSVVKYHALSSLQTRNVQLCGRGRVFKYFLLCDFRLPPRCTRDLRFCAASSGNPISMLRANL